MLKLIAEQRDATELFGDREPRLVLGQPDDGDLCASHLGQRSAKQSDRPRAQDRDAIARQNVRVGDHRAKGHAAWFGQSRIA